MYPNAQQGQKPSALKRAMELFAKTFAFIIAFIVTGPSYVVTVPIVRDFVANTYSPQLTGVVSVFWFIAMAILVFAVSTLVTVLLLQIISAWLSKLSFR